MAFAGAIFQIGYRNARADPIVRGASLQLPRWPEGAAPVTVALFSDLHLGNATMDRTRLTRIVGQVNGLRPDLIVITGDMVSWCGAGRARRAAPILTQALRGLRAPLGTVAILGNHDHDSDATLLTRALGDAGVSVLTNGAVRRGPLAIGGLDDPATGRERIRPMLAALDPLPGARMVLAHSPKPIWHLPKGGTLLLAGHTHCGQIVIPGLWQLMADMPDFRCGVVHDRRRTTIVSGGLGTSRLPLRFGAPPDIWLIKLGPIRMPGASAPS